MNHFPFSQPKQFLPGDGSWCPSKNSRLVFLDGPIPWEAVAACINLLGDEFPMLGAAAQLRNVSPLPGDLVIKGDSHPDLKDIETFQEGFVIEVKDQVLTLTAQSERAVIAGLRTILESLKADGNLPGGKLIDYPSTKVRGLHLDMGRKHFSKDWILNMVRELSHNRMNELCLHFSENQGFRIESDRHPEVPSRFHHSKDDIREIIHLANAYHIDIVPALDCPGHLGQALQEHPRWQLEREMAEPLFSALDITNPQARAFVLDLLDEYADLFADSNTFHIGGDEFIDFNHFERYPKLDAYAKDHLGPNCSAVDTYLDFLNQVIRHVQSKGFQVRVWNDGLFRLNLEEHIPLEQNVQIAYWSSWDKAMAPLQTFLDRGYQVLNYNGDFLYHILLQRDGYSDPSAEKISSEWSPVRFPTHHVAGEQLLSDPHSKQFLGCCFSIWCDWPDLQEETEVFQRSQNALHAFGVRCWA